MKVKRALVLVAVFVVVISALLIIHSVKNPGDYVWEIPQEDGVNMVVGEDELMLTVRFDDDGEFFEIARDIVISADENFAKPLKQQSSVVREGDYMYVFRVKDADQLQKIYLKPPVLFKPIETAPVTVPLVCGEVAKMSADAEEAAGAEWFTVENIHIEKDSKDYYMVQLTLDAHRSDLPRYLKVVNDGMTLAEMTSQSYKDDHFIFDEFTFFVNAESEEAAAALVKESSLVFTGALLRADAQMEVVSSSVENLSIIVMESE